MQNAASVDLVAEGIDAIATVTLNGVLQWSGDNAFHTTRLQLQVFGASLHKSNS
jgi:hypothetical protein